MSDAPAIAMATAIPVTIRTRNDVSRTPVIAAPPETRCARLPPQGGERLGAARRRSFCVPPDCALRLAADGAHSIVSSIACSGRSSRLQPRRQFSIATCTERTAAAAKPSPHTP